MSKKILVFGFTVLWIAASLTIALPWISDITAVFNKWIAWIVVMGIAIIPGAAMAMVYSTLSFYSNKSPEKDLDVPVTVLVAAYNERDSIKSTIDSIQRQSYKGDIQIIVCDDGSTDGTSDVLKDIKGIQHLRLEQNGGKAKALNKGLTRVTTPVVITVDADTELHDNAIQRIVNRLDNSEAVAGSVLVKNFRDSFMSRIQHWDYMLGMTVVKRTQAKLGGTLVAQGAFSAYKTEVLRKVGGWKDTVGEDIVLSWDMLVRNYKIDYEPNAIVFTNVPTGYKAFFKQRKRWSRGLIEAFKSSPKILLKPSSIMRCFLFWIYVSHLYLYHQS